MVRSAARPEREASRAAMGRDLRANGAAKVVRWIPSEDDVEDDES